MSDEGRSDKKINVILGELDRWIQPWVIKVAANKRHGNDFSFGMCA